MKNGSAKLMIVDDSNIIRGRITRAVEQNLIPDVAVVGLAKNGREAVQLCRMVSVNMASAPEPTVKRTNLRRFMPKTGT